MRNLPALLAFSGLALALSGCPPTYPKCSSDDHCQEKGEVCVQGQCRECATDKNCKPGFVCDLSRCVPKPECVADSSCPGGKKCKAGKCQVDAKPVKVEGSCVAHEDCPSGQECKAGFCADVPVAKSCTFEPVRFDFNDYTLAPQVSTKLTEYADCMKKGSLRFMLEGHADERGTEEYNMQLSQKRAASVRKYLVDLGVPAPSLDTVGYGENKPAIDGHNEEAWSANRRVEFKAKK